MVALLAKANTGTELLKLLEALTNNESAKDSTAD